MLAFNAGVADQGPPGAAAAGLSLLPSAASAAGRCQASTSMVHAFPASAECVFLPPFGPCLFCVIAWSTKCPASSL